MVRSPIFNSQCSGWRRWLHVTSWAQIGHRIPASRETAGFLLTLLVVATIGALVGGVLARRMLVVQVPLTAVVSTGHLAETGRLLLQVGAVTWLARAITVGRRLHVDLRLQNSTERTQAVGPHEFNLHARSGASWVASGGSLAATTLGPGQDLTGTIIFDVPAPVPGLQLVWVTGYREVRLPLGVASAGLLPTGGGARR